MNLRSVEEVAANTKVVLQMDLDVPINNGIIEDNFRLEKSIPTIKLLLQRNCKIAIIGYHGRPKGMDPSLSLKPVYVELMSMLENEENMVESVFVADINDKNKLKATLDDCQILFVENLRFWPEEDKGEAQKLREKLSDFEVFVNDALAVSHRESASVMLYKVMPGYYGLSFIEEVSKIEKVLQNPEHPVTIVLGGAKEDKLDYVSDLVNKADNILIGGKLPHSEKRTTIVNDSKIIWAGLRNDGFDLSDEDIFRFKEILNNSKTIIWAGAMGKFEDQNARRGTEEIARAVATAPAYKILAGGDTGASVEMLGLKDRIDLVASGGGALLTYLTKGKLPAWE